MCRNVEYKIAFSRTENVHKQLNSLKEFFVQQEMKLGEKYTIEIAVLLSSVERLIDFYDTRHIVSKFNSTKKSINEVLNKSMYLNIEDSYRKIELLNVEFFESKSNKLKKTIIFELYFHHIQILFDAYKVNYNKVKLKPEIEQKKATNHSEFFINYLNKKQRTKYLTYSKNLKKPMSSFDKNKIRAKVSYYEKLAKTEYERQQQN